MRNEIILFLLGVISAILQTTVFSYISIGWTKPDIILLIVIYIGLNLGGISGCILSFILGYIIDLLSGSYFGMYSFQRVLIFLIAYESGRRFYRLTESFEIITVLVLTLIDGLVSFSISYLLGINVGFVESLLRIIIPHILFASTLSTIVFYIINKTLVFQWKTLKKI